MSVFVLSYHQIIILVNLISNPSASIDNSSWLSVGSSYSDIYWFRIYYDKYLGRLCMYNTKMLKYEPKTCNQIKIKFEP